MTNPIRSSSKHAKKVYVQELQKVLQEHKTSRELEFFLEDFFSPAEIRRFVKRWKIGELLAHGLSQREVKQRLSVSISKVSRCAYVLRYGNGSFRRSANRSKIRPRT